MQPVEEQSGPVAEAHIGGDADAAITILRDECFARFLRGLLVLVGREIAKQMEGGHALPGMFLQMSRVIDASEAGFLPERQMPGQGGGAVLSEGACHDSKRK